MPDFEITEVAYVLATMLVAWLGWPVANRIRSLAMIDVVQKLTDIEEKLSRLGSRHGSHMSALELRLAILEEKQE